MTNGMTTEIVARTIAQNVSIVKEITRVPPITIWTGGNFARSPGRVSIKLVELRYNVSTSASGKWGELYL